MVFALEHNTIAIQCHDDAGLDCIARQEEIYSSNIAKPSQQQEE